MSNVTPKASISRARMYVLRMTRERFLIGAKMPTLSLAQPSVVIAKSSTSGAEVAHHLPFTTCQLSMPTLSH